MAKVTVVKKRSVRPHTRKVAGKTTMFKPKSHVGAKFDEAVNALAEWRRETYPPKVAEKANRKAPMSLTRTEAKWLGSTIYYASKAFVVGGRNPDSQFHAGGMLALVLFMMLRRIEKEGNEKRKADKARRHQERKAKKAKNK